jgi:RHS repeat-associated protein
MLRKLVVLLALLVLAGCGNETLPISTSIGGEMIPPPRPGIASLYSGLMFPVPGGRVNASGGNLYIARSDMSVDTQVRGWSVGAVWNSANGAWQWSFDSTLLAPQSGQPPIFTDSTGYGAFLKGIAYGEPIPGTHWVSHDSTSVRTSGGMIYHFAEDGWLESVNWASADYPSIEFERMLVSGTSRVTNIDQCTDVASCSTIYTLSFDAQGRISAIVDVAGRQTFYTYDATSERLASVRDPLDVQKGWPGTRYEYDSKHRLSAITNSHDERIEYRYYGLTNTVKDARQMGEGDPTWTFVYTGLKDDRLHASTTATDPLGKSSTFVFDFALRTKSFTNADGEKWQWVWSDSDLKAQISPTGVSRAFSLSSDRSVLTQTFASGNVMATTYAPFPSENRVDPFERPILQIVDTLGLQEARTYSAAGVPESISNGAGDTTTYVIVSNGDLTITDPAGVVTSYSNQGDHGNYQTVTRGSETVNRTFDLIGNLLNVDGLIEEDSRLNDLSIGQGGLVSRTYDGNRNVSTVMLEDSGGAVQSELRIEWRTDYQQTMVERPFGGDTEFQYDEFGRMIAERILVNGSWIETTTEYDLNGQVSAVLKPNGMATRLTYRSSGQITSLRHELDWANPLEFDEEAEFDYQDGRRIAIRTSAHGMIPEHYDYDSAGLLDEVSFPGGEKITYGYDLRGRVDTKQYWRPDNSLLRTFAYQYDLSNRRTSVTENGTEILGATIVDGQVDRVLYGNGIEVVNSYTPSSGALAGFTATDSGMQVVATMTANMTTCSIQLPAGRCFEEQTDSLIGVVSTSYAQYQTEDLGSERLIADSYGVGSPVEGFYDYDQLSNLQESPAGSFVYNSERNRLLEIEKDGTTVVDYVYDDAGYVIERNEDQVAWNGMGLATSVGTDLAMQWDALGREVTATVAGETTNWKYGGEMTENEIGGQQKLDLGWVICHLDTSSHEYRLFDFRGNAKLMLDDAGTVIAHNHYSGYSQVAVDGSDASKMGYAGGTHIDELVLMGARIYDPIAGRFLSEDPIRQIFNQYSYTLGNPVRFWDPTGFEQTPQTTQTKTFKWWVRSSPWPWLGFSYDVETKSVESSPGSGATPKIDVPPVQPGATHQPPAIGPGVESSVPTSTTQDAAGTPAFKGSFKSRGSTDRGKDGPAPKVPKIEIDPPTSCGLGFEVILVLLVRGVIRNRRNGRSILEG